MSPGHDGDDPGAGNHQDTRPTGVMAPPPWTPKPTSDTPASAVQDAPANGGPATDDAGTDGPVDARDDTAAEAVPALPADTIGARRDSTVVFPKPAAAPVSPGADDWMPSEAGQPSPGDSSAVSAAALAEPHAGSSKAQAASAVEPSAEGPSPAASGTSAGPSPSTVSAAAFTWETPQPAPIPAPSPARNYLRSNANAQTVAGSGAAGAAVGAAAATSRTTEPSRDRSPKRSPRRQARQAHLTVARVEPWSVMKLSFVVSLVAFVILFVAVSVLYGALSALGVFESLQRVVTNLTSSQDSAGVNAAKWFTASKVLGYTGLLGSLNIVLITAMCTIGAVVYNLTSRLIGGVEVTLRETE
jgi:Transmembrane domain of unknown function (DUF3566)